MSNKTQLQTNNTELSSLIETIRGKVAGSGGSGGGSIETCVVTIEQDFVGPPAPGSELPSFYYTDGSMSLKFIETDSGAFTVAKNTIVAISGWYGASTVGSGSAEEIFYRAGYAAYKITGDCTLLYMI